MHLELHITAAAEAATAGTAVNSSATGWGQGRQGSRLSHLCHLGMRGRSNPGRESRQALPPPVGGQEQRGARFQGMLAALCWVAGTAERATPCTLCQPRLRWRSNRARDFRRVLPAPIGGRNSGARDFKPRRHPLHPRRHPQHPLRHS